MAISDEPVMTFVPTGVTVVGAKNVQAMERMFISQTKNSAIEPIQVYTSTFNNRFSLELLMKTVLLKKLSFD